MDPLIFNIFCDGGARGNPGPAAVGFAVKDEEGKILAKVGKAIGITTNNVAEYQAVVEALRHFVPQGKLDEPIPSRELNLHLFLDSKLVVNQLNGFYKIKEPKLRDLLMKVRTLEQEVGGRIFYHQIPREKNFLADSLVNQALDA